MKIIILSTFLCMVNSILFGQNNFEKGYFIDNNEAKIECLIKNFDWKNNPVDFEYKLTATDVPKKNNLTTAKEFGVYGYSKYIRADVNIDLSSNRIADLTTNSNPVWTLQRIFLKVLIEGKATLYYYEDVDLKRFFYSVSGSTINQLVYRDYLQKNSDLQIATNYRFRQQLYSDIRCANTNIKSIERINYNQSELEKYFVSYNSCEGEDISKTYQKENRENFNLKITSGINYASLTLKNTVLNTFDTNFNSNISFILSIEGEFILPFHKNNWSLLANSMYFGYHSKQNISGGTTSINYESIEFSLGVRHYIFLNTNTRIFLNGIYVLPLRLNNN